MSRKRQFVELKGVTDAKKAKKVNATEYTGLVFKLELKTSQDVINSLEKFNLAVEKWNSGEKANDIVADYVKATEDCSELVTLLNQEHRRKPTEYASIFKVLHAILVRTADDVTSSPHVAKLTSQILSRLDLVYFMLQQKPEQIKIALKLLTSIVIQDYHFASDVLLQFDFQHRAVMPILSRRNYLDEEDCRTCLMSFYLSFIIHGDNSTVQQFLQMKGVLNSIFPNVVNDHAQILEILLQTVLERIVKEPFINKTLKLRLFDAVTLEHLSSLYQWKGPTKWRSKEEPVLPQEELVESAEKISVLTHQLLTELCCSHKNGVNFYDKTLGLGGKNHNPVLTAFILAKKLPDDNPELRNLLINIMTTCPDLIGRYMTSLQHDFEPRFTSQWLNRMGFLNQLYSQLPAVPNVLKQASPKPGLVPAVMVTLCPPQIVQNSVIHAIKHQNNANIRHVGLRQVNLLLTHLTEIVAYCRTVGGEGTDEFVNKLRGAVVKVVPDLRSVTSCWYFLMNPPKDKNTPQKIEQTQCIAPDSFPLEAMYRRILATIHLYQTMLSDFYPDQTIDLSMLIDGVQQCVERSTSTVSMETSDDVTNDTELSDELAEVCHGLLSVMAASDARKIPWGKKNKSGRSLIYQLLNSTGLFESCRTEVTLWLRPLPTLPDDVTHAVLTFLDKVITTLIANAQIYYDLIADAVGERDVAMETDETGSVTSAAAEIEAILAHDIEDLYSRLEEKLPDNDVIVRRSDVTSAGDVTPISALVPACLKVLKNWEAMEVETYVTDVLTDIFHTQTTPTVLVNIMDRYPDSILNEGLIVYMKTFTETKFQKTPAPDVSALSEFHSSLRQCWLSGMESLSDDDVIKKLKKNINQSQARDVVVGQSASLMMSHVMLCLQGLVDKTPPLPVLDALFTLLRRIMSNHSIQLYQQLLRHPLVQLEFLNHRHDVISTHLDAKICELLSQLPDEKVVELKPDFSTYCERLLACSCQVPARILQSCVRFLDTNVVTDLLLKLEKKPKRCAVVMDFVMNSTDYEFDYSLMEGLKRNLGDHTVRVLVRYINKSTIHAVCLDVDTVSHVLENKMDADLTSYTELVALAVRYNGSQEIRRVVGRWLRLRVGDDEEMKFVGMAVAYMDVMDSSKEKELLKAKTKIVLPYWNILLDKLFKSNLSDVELSTLIKFTGHQGQTDASRTLPRLKRIDKNVKMTNQFVTFLCGVVKDMEMVNVNEVKILFTLMIRVTGEGEKLERLFTELVGLVKRWKSRRESTTAEFADVVKETWPKLSRAVLKHQYQCPQALHFLAAILDSKVGLDLTAFIQMMTSHSQFMDVMMEGTENGGKAALIELLMTSCLSDVKSHISLLPMILGAYNASLHRTDQRLLQFLMLLDTSGADVKQYRPYLWGRPGLDHITSKRNLGPSLTSQVTGDQVLALLDSERLIKSMLNFPLHRKLLANNVKDYEFGDDIKSSEIYDPCFVLPLFSSVLRNDTVLHMRDFLERGCLGYLLSGLSSHCPDVRGVIYYTLSRLLEQLEGARFRERGLVANLMQLVKHSLNEPNQRLPVIMTVFWAKSSTILLDPGSHLYSQINNFLLLKPSLEVGDVPEFYKFFNSATLEHKQERSWMLTLLSEGVRDVTDYAIYQKRQVFRHIMSFHDSVIAEERAKCDVIKVVTSCVRVNGIARRLVKNHGLLSWLGAAVSNSISEQHLKALSKCLCHLWTATSAEQTRKLPLSITDSIFNIATQMLNKMSPQSVTDEHLAIVRTLAGVVRDVESRDSTTQKISTPESVISSLLRIHETITSSGTTDENKTVSSETTNEQVLKTSVNDIFMIVTHWPYLQTEKLILDTVKVTMEIVREQECLQERFLTYFSQLCDLHADMIALRGRNLMLTFISLCSGWKQRTNQLLKILDALNSALDSVADNSSIEIDAETLTVDEQISAHKLAWLSKASSDVHWR